MVLDSISRNNGNVTVVIPESVCATCFNELLSYLAKSCQEESFFFGSQREVVCRRNWLRMYYLEKPLFIEILA